MQESLFTSARVSRFPGKLRFVTGQLVPDVKAAQVEGVVAAGIRVLSAFQARMSKAGGSKPIHQPADVLALHALVRTKAT
jgi:hypothetical protein